MKLKLYDTIKNNSNFFSMRTATKTFKSLMENQIIEKKLKRRKILSTKTDQFFNMINKAFFKQDIKEKDQDYIYSEIKRLQKHRQNLIELYGKNSQKKFLNIEPEPIKYDKTLLFNPYKNEENKSRNEKKEKFDIFFKEEKRKKLPFILRQNNVMKLCRNNYSKSRNGFNKSIFSEKNNISRYNSLNTESSSKYKNQYLTVNKNNKNNNVSKFSISSDRSRFNRNDYLETLDSFYEEIINNHKKQKRYFNSCDYGCTFFKNKCKFIYKTLFNKQI
jgi:hypothetical protein